jgi:hypothetical protein
MKQFIIINGKEVINIKAADLDQATQKAINICDHSKEIIVREVESPFEDIEKQPTIKKVTEQQQIKIEDFLNSLSIDHIDLVHHINVNELDFNNASIGILHQLEESKAFDIWIESNSIAMQYLMDNDPSLSEAIGLAEWQGFETRDWDSNLLASLLASSNSREEFWGCRDEINSFFKSL